MLRSRATRAPIDVSGWALEMVVKAKRADTDPLLTLSTAQGGLSLDPATPGRIIIQMTALQTCAIGAGNRVFAIYRVDGGQRLAVLTGRLSLLEGV